MGFVPPVRLDPIEESATEFSWPAPEQPPSKDLARNTQCWALLGSMCRASLRARGRG